MKIDININKPVLDLDGQPIENTNMAKILASQLIGSGTGDAIKFLDWAISLNKDGKIQVDNSDFETLKKFVTDLNGLPNLTKGQMLKELLAAKTPKPPTE